MELIRPLAMILCLLSSPALPQESSAVGENSTAKVASRLTLDEIIRTPIEEGTKGFDKISSALVKIYDFDIRNKKDLSFGKHKYVELADGYIVTDLHTSDPPEYFSLSIAKKPCFTPERAGLIIGPHKTVIGVHSEAMYFSATRGVHVNFDVPYAEYACVSTLGIRKLTKISASHPESWLKNSLAPSIETFLTAPLIEGRYGYLKVIETMKRIYAFDTTGGKAIQASSDSVQIGDGFNLESATVYGTSSRVVVDVSTNPCFAIERAIEITDAKESPLTPREYRDVRLYRARGRQTIVEFASSYRDQKCLAAISIHAAAGVQFPDELHGLWIGSAQICPTDREYFDGEFLLEISPKAMFGYEEKYKPTSLLIASTSPKSWRIEVTTDVGPSGYFSESDPMTLTLDEEVLKVERDGIFKTYKKCHLKTTEGETT